MPDDGSCELKHVALRDMMKCCVGRHIFACLWCSYLLYSSCPRHYLSYCVSRGGGVVVVAGNILLLYSTGLCTPPWRQFTSSEFVLCSACGFLCMKYAHSNFTYSFYAVKTAAHGASAPVAVCRVLVPFSSIVLHTHTHTHTHIT